MCKGCMCKCFVNMLCCGNKLLECKLHIRAVHVPCPGCHRTRARKGCAPSSWTVSCTSVQCTRLVQVVCTACFNISQHATCAAIMCVVTCHHASCFCSSICSFVAACKAARDYPHSAAILSSMQNAHSSFIICMQTRCVQPLICAPSHKCSPCPSCPLHEVCVRIN